MKPFLVWEEKGGVNNNTYTTVCSSILGQSGIFSAWTHSNWTETMINPVHPQKCVTEEDRGPDKYHEQ